MCINEQGADPNTSRVLHSQLWHILKLSWTINPVAHNVLKTRSQVDYYIQIQTINQSNALLFDLLRQLSSAQ